MPFEDKLWRWYERHDHAINAVLDIAGDVVPGGKLVLHGMKAVHGWWKDQRENENQDQAQEMQECLASLKPVIADLVEEIEENKGFQGAAAAEQQKKIVQQHFAAELAAMMPRLTISISRSASRLSAGNPQKTQLLNQKYELLQLLGSGGQGEVYLANDREANKRFAIKLLPEILSRDTTAIESLRHEFNRVVDLLVHPQIVQYRSMAQDGESKRWFVVMDYVPGKNLRQWLLERGRRPVPFAQAIQMLQPVAEALEFAHGKRVVHCDLKPENLLRREGEEKMMLADFGLAREIRSTLSARSAPGNISGTLPYMAPEQYQGKNPDARTDIWALGVIAYELTAGYHPFQGTSFEHFMKLVCDLAPDPPQNLAREEWQGIERMLQKDRQHRPASAVEALRMMARPPASEAQLANRVMVDALRMMTAPGSASVATNKPGIGQTPGEARPKAPAPISAGVEESKRCPPEKSGWGAIVEAIEGAIARAISGAIEGAIYGAIIGGTIVLGSGGTIARAIEGAIGTTIVLGSALAIARVIVGKPKGRNRHRDPDRPD